MSGSKQFIISRWGGRCSEGKEAEGKGAVWSASLNGMPGGQPSTTQPMAGPWLSPQVVKRKAWPKVFPVMAGASRQVLAAGRQALDQLGDLVPGPGTSGIPFKNVRGSPRRAARVLERETGVASDTLAKLLHEWQRNDRPPLGRYRLAPYAGRIANPMLRLAERLRRGDRVLVLTPPGLDFIAAFLGTQYAGMIAVPAPAVPDVLKETFAEHKAKTVLLIPGGMGETEGGIDIG